ncbi:hypothetical protein GQ54DRAFT_296964 [Martensiomyces pterosporus]|nr:hypothetical protein GQ54DRAFT_296964 [Martensiomyces pterosporus]
MPAWLPFIILGIRRLGIVPQYLVADALAMCTPKQLETIERFNPHIIEDNEPLWMAHCTRSYKELRELPENIAQGIAPPVPSWRRLYWEMKHQDEVRAQEIAQRVRNKVAEIERAKSSRKVRMTKMPVSAMVSSGCGGGLKSRGGWGASGLHARNLSPFDRARIETKVHMSKMTNPVERRNPGAAVRSLSTSTTARPRMPPSSPAPAPAPAPRQQQEQLSPRQRCSNYRQQHTPPPQPAMATATAAYPSQTSPYESPAHSPPYQAASYSPPYFSSASSCSPTHSAASPPYVPDSGSNSQNEASSSSFNLFDDIFGWSPRSTGASRSGIFLTPTATITEQTVYRKVPAQPSPERRKRMRRDGGSRQREHSPSGGSKGSKTLRKPKGHRTHNPRAPASAFGQREAKDVSNNAADDNAEDAVVKVSGP